MASGDTPGADDIYKPQRNRKRPARLRFPHPSSPAACRLGLPPSDMGLPKALYTDSPNFPSASFPAADPVSLEMLGKHLPAGSE